MAVFAALAAMALVSALTASLLLAGAAESAIAANFRAATEARFAAEAVLTAAVADLGRADDWTDVPGGALVASFGLGAESGVWELADGTSIDVAEAINLANCQKRTPCSAPDLAAVIADRPWGAGNPQWRLFAVTYLGDLVSDAMRDRCLVVAMVADDPADNDGDPLHDGLEPGGQSNPGRGVLRLRGEAFCTRRAHKVVEATIARSAGTGGDLASSVWLVSRREIN
jgi:hypothetical protein